jgi:cell division protein FtsQ
VGAQARRALPALAALAISAALAAGGVLGFRFLTRSSRFAIRELRLSPLVHTSREELLSLLPMSVGDNIFRADLRAARHELAQHPWVARVRVARELPGTVVIDVTEREPAAAVRLEALYLCDAHGHLFKRATTAEAEGLWVVTGLDRERYAGDPTGAEATVREALAAARTFSAAGRPAVSEVAIHPTLGVTLFLLHGGVELRLGRGDLVGKLARYDFLLAELARRCEKARSIALDSQTRPDRIAVRLEKAREGG